MLVIYSKLSHVEFNPLIQLWTDQLASCLEQIPEEPCKFTDWIVYDLINSGFWVTTSFLWQDELVTRACHEHL